MLRLTAKIISIIFHPLLLLTYMVVLLLTINPYLFGVVSIKEKVPLVMIIFFSSFLIPAMSVVMMKFLGFVKSLEMKEKKERIGPYIITGIFYLWLVVIFYHNPEIPIAVKIFILGSTIALFVAFFINNFYKISIHGVGMGGFLAMIIITVLKFSYNEFVINAPLLGMVSISTRALLIIAILLTGLVGTSRLILKAHTSTELYSGFFVGFITQFIAFLYFT